MTLMSVKSKEEARALARNNATVLDEDNMRGTIIAVVEDSVAEDMSYIVSYEENGQGLRVVEDFNLRLLNSNDYGGGYYHGESL